MDLSHISYLAFLAPFALFFQQARSWISQAFSFLIRNEKVKISSWSQYEFIYFLKTVCKEIKFGNTIYKSDNTYYKQSCQSLNSFFIFREKYIFLFKGFIPIIVTPHSFQINCLYLNLFDFTKLLYEYEKYNHRLIENLSKENDTGIPYGRGFGVYEIRGVGSKMNSLSKATIGSDASSSGNSSGSKESDSLTGLSLSSKTYEYLSITPHIGGLNTDEISFVAPPEKEKSKYYFTEEGQKISHEVQNWLGSKKWYNDRQIRWYRGCCLYGRPGLGKSVLILEIAKKLKLPIYIFDLKTMDNEEFSKEIEKIIGAAIILFEDFDTVFHGRTNLCKSKMFEGLSFDCFLNKLGGVNAIRDSFVFITTNHIDKLDPALLRDGRIDSKIELKPLTKEGKIFIAEKMLDLWPEMVYKVVSEEEETAAQFENKCTKLALELYWKDKNKTEKTL